jgi:hypothetical protein
MAGRPTKLTPEVQGRIVQAVAAGNYYEAAAAYGGITYVTLTFWMNRGEAEAKRLEESAHAKPKEREAPFLAFFNAIQEAEAKAEVRVVAQWQAQIPENWQAARDFLSRRYPERWGRERHEVTGKNGDDILIRVQYADVDADTAAPAFGPTDGH